MSDQRIKIENAIACAFGIGWNVQHDGVIKSSQLYIDKRNDCIHRYADEIESLIRSAAPPRELVEAAEATARALAQLMVAVVTLGLDETEPSISEVLERHNGVGAEMTKQIAIARAALSAQEPKVCPDCGGDGVYQCSKCGGCGYESAAEHDPHCDGSCRNCPVEVQVPCGECGGWAQCPTCHGSGTIEVKEG